MEYSGKACLQEILRHYGLGSLKTRYFDAFDKIYQANHEDPGKERNEAGSWSDFVSSHMSKDTVMISMLGAWN